MPGWLTPAGVYAAWLAESVLGFAGYALLRRRYRIPGLGLIVLYAVFGLGGLMHYALAPVAAHTLGMNATIWAEVAAAILLLTIVVPQLRWAKS